MDLRDIARIGMTREYLEKLQGEIVDMYHNAKINFWPEKREQKDYDYWLEDHIEFGVKTLDDILTEKFSEDENIYCWGRCGATCTLDKFWKEISSALHHYGFSNDTWVEDYAGERNFPIDVKKYKETNDWYYGYEAPEDAYIYAKSEYELAKFINEYVKEFVAGIKDGWEYHKQWMEEEEAA